TLVELLESFCIFVHAQEQLPEIVVDLGVARISRSQGSEGFGRFLEPSRFGESTCQVVARVGVIGLKLKRCMELCNRLARAAERAQGQSEPVVPFWLLRIEADCLFECLFCAAGIEP